MPAILIVADDLSGAADCGIGCVESGLEAAVLFGETLEAPDVLCIDADTRRLSVDRAAEETARLLSRHAGPGTLLYKKLDSTLRGHIGAEIAAALGVLHTLHPGARPLAIVAPAFPGTGRITRGGRQYLNGAPVEETELWRGKEGRADLPEMLAAHGLAVAHIDLARVRASDLARAMAATAHDALVCDAETEDDLKAIAEAGRELGAGILWVGSGGLARHLPQAYGLARIRRNFALPPVTGALLFVVGSLSQVSRVQADRLAADPDVATLSVPPHILTSGPGTSGSAEQGARLDAACAAGRDIVVLIGAEEPAADGSRLCSALARLLKPYAARCGGLFLTGGETARAVLQALGVGALRLAGEIEPGVPLAMAEGGVFQDRPVVTKAGAFGTPDSMRRCRDILRAGLAIQGGLAEETAP